MLRYDDSGIRKSSVREETIPQSSKDGRATHKLPIQKIDISCIFIPWRICKPQIAGSGTIRSMKSVRTFIPAKIMKMILIWVHYALIRGFYSL